jgi:hypothetical protein
MYLGTSRFGIVSFQYKEVNQNSQRNTFRNHYPLPWLAVFLFIKVSMDKAL